MKFVKKEELTLKGSGYLVCGKEEIPVNHDEFVKIQDEAHYLINLAAKVKDTDFTKKTVKSFEQIVNEVKLQLNDEKRAYVAKVDNVETPLADALKNEALSWLKGKSDSTKSEKLNAILQKYNLLAEFEEFGIYMSTDKIVKLKAIYTLQQIIDAVVILEPHLSI